MELSITLDASAARELDQFAAKFPGAIEAGVRAVAGVAERMADKQIGRIYARAIPLRKNGKPLWTRSGELMAGRETIYPTSSSAVLQITGNAAVYAASRHELGVSWTPKNPAGGVVRRNPFFADTVEKITPQVPDVFNQAVRNSLGL